MQQYTIADLEKMEETHREFYKKGNYREALNYAQQALEIAKFFFSASHPRVAICYTNLAFYQRILCRYNEAEANLMNAIKITEKAEGRESPDLCTPLANLASLYQEMGQYREAEQNFRKSLEITMKEYGPANPNVPLLLNNLGLVLYRQGRYGEAETHYQSAINNWKSLKGPSYPDIAIPMANLGELYLDLGRYSDAEKNIRQGLEIMRQAVPPMEHSLETFYDRLGRLHYVKGEYQHSLEHHNKALEIRRRVFGDEHSLTAQSIVNIAMTLKVLGRYDRAESMYLEALEIYKKIYDGNHPYIATTMNNLALIYETIGDYERAEFYLHQALENKINELGPDHYDLVVLYINLAGLCFYKEDEQKALEHCQKARDILDQTVAPDSPNSAYLYNTMANLFQKQERYNDAEIYFKKSINIYERSQNPDPDGLSTVLVNIASLYQDEKNYLKAEECLKRAIQIREDGISPDHPGIINSLLNLAILRIVRGNYPSAISLFKRILLLQENYIDMVFTFAGEEQKLEFIDHMSTAYLITLSALYNFMLREDPKMIALGFETVLQRKGIVLDSEARSNKVFHHKMKGELKDTWDERSEKLSRLAQLLLVTTAAEGNKTVETDPADRKDKIKRLQKEIEELERSLKKEAALELPAQPKVTLREITNALPDGSALLEFVKIKDYNFSNSKTPWGITRYIVFIVRKNGDVRMVDLGNSELIDAYIEESLQLIRWEKNDIEKLRESLYHLSSNIWNELEYYLDGIKRLIICPDGLLNLVPFAALIDKNLKYLVERFTISYVTNSREIVQTPRKIIDRDYQLVLVADPDFNYQGVNSTSPGNKIQSREPSFPMKFKRLKGTKRESELIPPLVPVQDFLKKIVTGKEATKETVLSVVDPGILHLATHGFFNNENLSAITSKPLTFGEMMSEQINDLTNMANPKQPAKKPTTSKRSRALTHSGLALAGANRADLESGNANGLLTGLEVTGMQLSGTDLVVLSACDTGFSEFMSGEGVFGLRRAFAIAGARNLVMSLWPVNDECTTEQMGMFYRNLQRMPPAEALRQAQLQTMEKDVRGILPVIWAPFIIQGGQAQTALIYGPPRE